MTIRDVPENERNFRVTLACRSGGAYGFGLDQAEAMRHARHFQRKERAWLGPVQVQLVERWADTHWETI